MRRWLVAVASASLFAPLSAATPAKSPADRLPPVAEKTAGMEKRDGFLPLYWDAKKGKVFLEVQRLGEDLCCC